MLRTTSYIMTAVAIATSVVPPSTLAGQTNPPDTVRAIARLHGVLERHGAAIGPRIWPGFRPDTVHVLYVIPHRAKLLVPWADSLARGFAILPGAPNAAWADTQPVSWSPRKLIASLSIDSTMSAGDVLGLAIHEAFHSYEQSARRADRSFGQWENTMLVARYPVFDVANEAAWALEGRLLRDAFAATTLDDTRRLARQFLAVRGYRRARLDTSMVQFERFAEVNEGLAQYSLVRGLAEFAAVDGTWRAAAAEAVRTETRLLDSVLAIGRRSVRRRYYSTGPIIGLILDRLTNDAWKAELMTTQRVLEDVLATATGYRGPASLGPSWDSEMQRRLEALRPDAERSVAALRTRRDALRDSVLASPGLRVTIDPARLPGGRFSPCAFDPQNMLPTADGTMLHMRMLRACNGNDVTADIEQAAVERASGTIVTVIADPATLRVTSAGRAIPAPAVGGAPADLVDVRIEAPGVTVTAPRLLLARDGDGLRLTPMQR